MIIYKTLAMHQAAKQNDVPCSPNVSSIIGKYFITINAVIHIINVQNVMPKSFSLSGMISVITRYGKLNTASDTTNMVNEILTTGIKLNASTS